MKRYALWLLIPFAAAAASDCGAPLTVLIPVAIAWLISAAVWLERYRRRTEQERQRELNRRLRECHENVPERKLVR